ncbi:MAG: zinc-binding alcohol dehydrogenase family protein [Hyphomicrobiales bacterium]|nr:zinc-binding alcohol dehydrogenase family protein [Hyphomicrobiales bacterium]
MAEFAEPAAGAGETLVEVRAAAIKQLDRAIASGSHYASPKDLPIVCGTDGVGLASDGRRVYFVVRRRPFGSMAERAPAALTVPLPDGLDDASAAGSSIRRSPRFCPSSGGGGSKGARRSSSSARPARRGG